MAKTLDCDWAARTIFTFSCPLAKTLDCDWAARTILTFPCSMAKTLDCDWAARMISYLFLFFGQDFRPWLIS